MTTESNSFFSKTFYSLIVPYVVLSILKNLHFYISHFSLSNVCVSLLYILGGIHGDGEIPGCGNLWFVYALLINKIVLYVFGRYKYFFVAPCIFFSLFYHNFIFMTYSFAIINSFLSYPFFVLGKWFKERGAMIMTFGLFNSLLISLALYCCVWLISIYNGPVSFWLGEYGNNYILFWVGSIIGIIATFFISSSIKTTPFVIRIVSSGCIVILAFQMPIVRYVSQLPYIIECNQFLNNLLLFIVSIVIAFSFCPIIIFFQKYLPWVIGNRK